VTGSAPRTPLLLVVDDNPMNVEPLCDLLEAMDYRVATALDGATALRLVEEDPPDLILLDIMMPGMNGYEVCRKLKQNPRHARIPVVFVTALSESEDKVKAIDAGGDDFLTKPFNRPVLLARIRSLLRLKEASDQLEESYRKLQALERMKDDLMKMIVHDLKSPLSAVLATFEVILDGDVGPLGDDQRQLLDAAQEHGSAMLQLIDDLLELTRLEETRLLPERQFLRVDELLLAVRDEWRLRLERDGISLRVEDGTDLVAHADPQLLRRVLGNLVGNAARHGGEGIEIRLSASAAPGDGGVLFSVADNGVGIPPAFHDLIFRKFGSVHRAGGGGRPSSGIGLTFCKLAVEAHGGQIWVDSREGEGSTFRFVIPDVAVPEAAAPPSAAAARGTVAVAEPDPSRAFSSSG
jgi:two-component system, sensor histidine kinase and response regulator